MDPDDLQLLDTYIQRGIALRNQPPEPTLAQLSAEALAHYIQRQEGRQDPPATSSGAAPVGAQARGGLYALGAAALTDAPTSIEPRQTSASGQQLTPLASHMSGSLAEVTRAAGLLNGSAPAPTGSSSRPAPPLPTLPTVRDDPFSRPQALPRPPFAAPPTWQDQTAAKTQMLIRGMPDASYLDPYQDAQAHIAKGQPAPAWDQMNLLPPSAQDQAASSHRVNEEPPTEVERFRAALLKSGVEGYRPDVYLDSREIPTVGIGHEVLPQDHLRLGDRPAKDLIEAFFQHDSATALDAAHKQAAEAGIQDPDFLLALASVNYQVGTDWNVRFKKTWALIKKGRYDEAAQEAARSRWFKQTPGRIRDFQAALRALPERSDS